MSSIPTIGEAERFCVVALCAPVGSGALGSAGAAVGTTDAGEEGDITGEPAVAAEPVEPDEVTDAESMVSAS